MSEGKLLQAKGIRQFEDHDYEGAAQTFKSAIDAFQQESDVIGVAEMQVNLGLAYRAMDNYDEAIQLMESGLATFREQKNRRLEAQAMGNMALAYSKQGNQEQAATFYREAAAIFRDLGDDDNYGETVLALADMLFKSGNLMQAVAAYEAGLEAIRNPTQRQKMAKQLLVVKNRLMGEKRAEQAGEEGKTVSDRRRRRQLRRGDQEKESS
ncbi:MAG: tetratricopeptide repeat protein [Anaerolineae bacterium]|nr:tetratricopeptide repeat protein [Anaerolineae bacterium]